MRDVTFRASSVSYGSEEHLGAEKRRYDVALWIGQGILAVVFAVSGGLKLVQSKERLLATGHTGVRDYPLGAIRVIAACELAAVLGLILPGVLGVAFVLTPLAAVGLAVVMVGAAVAHSRLHEPRNVAVNGLLFMICIAVAAGRLAGH